MIPMRTSTIFKSRWMALLWAAGIIWAAVEVAGGSGQAATNSQSNAANPADGQAASDDDVRTAADALGL